MKYRILRGLAIFLIVMAAYFLQNSLFTQVFYFQTIPNLLLIVTVVFGFLRGPYTGIPVGLLAGLLYDLHAGTLLGYYTLFYVYAGWFGGLFNRFFYLDELALPTVLCGVTDFLFGAYLFFLRCVLRNQTNFLPYLTGIILPEVVYTMICAIVFFRLILLVHNALEDAEKRSARRFV